MTTTIRHVASILLATTLLAVPARAQTAPPPAPATQPSPGQPSPAQTLVERGRYMTIASDCMPCHTRKGGTPFAGGRELATPFGTLSSPNITPDPDTGIGRWSDDQFVGALHDGIGRGGQYLYPVMPFTSYTRLTRDDALAIKAYLFTLTPVLAPRAPSGMAFPFDIRATLFAWRELFFRPGTFKPNPARSAEWNRGAYLVTGAAHCGECHSPRNILGATEQSASFSGGQVQQWLAPNISSDPLDGIGARSVDEIVTFLRTGTSKTLGVAFGPMSEVVHDSISKLTPEDVRAIAVYLKEGPDRKGPDLTASATPASLKNGQVLYLNNCAMCHQANGAGIPGAIPNLAGNRAILADRPDDLVAAMLNGLKGTGGYGMMPAFAGALSDSQVADLANYIRTAWANKGVADTTPAMVADIRAASPLGLGGSEAARAFDCPKIGSGIVAGAQADAGQVMEMASGMNILDRVDTMVAGLRKSQPGISDAAVTNTVMAAACPSIAANDALGTAEKRRRLLNINDLVQTYLAANPTPK